MGHTSWSHDSYRTLSVARASTGSNFAYSISTSSQPAAERRAHPSLNVSGVAFRESRDSTAHPMSTAIAILLDVTGSMRQVPMVAQKQLGGLMKLLTDRNYIVDPQIAFAGVGDATCDTVPIQISQFESGLEMDEALNNLYLEGGGGGDMRESYELALYFMARQVQADCWEKRDKRGYLFTVGDETAYPKVYSSLVDRYLNGGLASDLPFETLVSEVHARWNWFHIIPRGSAHFNDATVAEFWRKHVGQNVIMLSNIELITPTIGTTIGVMEGAIEPDRISEELNSIDMGSASAEITRAINEMIGDGGRRVARRAVPV